MDEVLDIVICLRETTNNDIKLTFGNFKNLVSSVPQIRACVSNGWRMRSVDDDLLASVDWNARNCSFRTSISSAALCRVCSRVQSRQLRCILLSLAALYG